MLSTCRANELQRSVGPAETHRRFIKDVTCGDLAFEARKIKRSVTVGPAPYIPVHVASSGTPPAARVAERTVPPDDSREPGAEPALSSSPSARDVSLSSAGCNTTEVSCSFLTGSRARLIILIHPSETIWVLRTGSSRQIINISPSVPTGEEELRRGTGQKAENGPIRSGRNMQETEKSLCAFDSICM